MPADVRIDASDFAALSRALKSYGMDVVRKEMSKELRAVARPIVDDMRSAVKGIDSAGSSGASTAQRAATTLRSRYRRGGLTARSVERTVGRSGLRESVARSLRIAVRDSGRRVGVYITTEGTRLPSDQRTMPRRLNTGRWRHPVFGDRNTWVTQSITPPGWFMKAADAHRSRALRQAEAVIEQYRDNLAARIAAETNR